MPGESEGRDVDRRAGAVLTAPPQASAVSPGLPRGVDVLLSAAGLIAASPVLVLAAAAVAFTSGFPMFFRQTRVGRGGKPFTLVKLRTMRVSGGGPEVTARGDARVTPVGRLLRRTKIDELPQLWNVLRGDMAVVGPRPEVARYVQYTDPVWQEVLRSKPGLTDPVTLKLKDEEALLAQVEGDRERFYRETLQPFKLRGYADYLRTRTWRSDLGVIWDTFRTVIWPGPAIRPVDLSGGPPRT